MALRRAENVQEKGRSLLLSGRELALGWKSTRESQLLGDACWAGESCTPLGGPGFYLNTPYLLSAEGDGGGFPDGLK